MMASTVFLSQRYAAFAFWLMLMSVQGLFAQTTIVTGRVLDSITEEPLPFVNVAFLGTKIGTVTDFDGNYRLDSYYASDSVVCSFVGYGSEVRRIKRDESQVIDFKLAAGSMELDQIIVRASEWENPAHPIIRGVLRYKDVNDREKLEAYEYEVYNKVEFDLNNITEKFTEKSHYNQYPSITK